MNIPDSLFSRLSWVKLKNYCLLRFGMLTNIRDGMVHEALRAVRPREALEVRRRSICRESHIFEDFSL